MTRTSPNPTPGDLHAIERTDPSRVPVAKHMSPTTYPANPACDRVELRDDPAYEARDIARVATARAMDFARSTSGKAAMNGAGDGYLDVAREYVNSALAQRCNPIRLSLEGNDCADTIRAVTAY